MKTFHLETSDIYGNSCLLAAQAETPEQAVASIEEFCENEGIALGYPEDTADDLREIVFVQPVCIIRYDP